MSTSIRNVSGTAFVVAEFRADENGAAAPIYNDPIVSVFLGDESRSAATRIAAGADPRRGARYARRPQAGGRRAHVLTDLRRHVARFHLSFDYLAEAVIGKTTGDAGIMTLVESFANMGAPWVSGISDIGRFAREMRVRLVENVQTAELYRTYWPSRPIESPIFHFYSICTLASDADVESTPPVSGGSAAGR